MQFYFHFFFRRGSEIDHDSLKIFEHYNNDKTIFNFATVAYERGRGIVVLNSFTFKTNLLFHKFLEWKHFLFYFGLDSNIFERDAS